MEVDDDDSSASDELDVGTSLLDWLAEPLGKKTIGEEIHAGEKARDDCNSVEVSSNARESEAIRTAINITGKEGCPKAAAGERKVASADECIQQEENREAQDKEDEKDLEDGFIAF